MTEIYFDLIEAAHAIAAELNPGDAAKRAIATRQYWHALYSDLCDLVLVGRYPETRLAIPSPLERPGSMLAFAGCVIGLSDLNKWLENVGVGIQLDGKAPVLTLPERTGALPSTAEISRALGPHLRQGMTEEHLMKLLGDVRSRPALAKFRTLLPRPAGAVWRPAGVVWWLRKNRYMSTRQAQAALKAHYPGDVDLLVEEQPEGEFFWPGQEPAKGA